ncbi:hypothetical protein [Nostoc sp.]|uniref:hypothetical protein n=1 Tax=Nostoc sp. TaxID=1180 RepID=UPI002FFBD84D
MPFRLRIDSLPAHTDQTRFLEGEAGNRAQPDDRCGLTLALTGSSYDETEPRKATHSRARAQRKTPDPTGDYSRRNLEAINGKSPGNPVVELVTSNGTINLSEGTNKNELWV